MKKFFAILGIGALTFCACLGTPKENVSVVFAENESSQPMSSSEQQESSEQENESSENELEPIDVDKEISSISQTAKDVIEVIKTVLNQPIVIGGTTFTLGMLLVWIFGKLIVKALDKRTTKQDKKINDCLTQVGFTQEQIKFIFDNMDLFREIIVEIINNMKNIQVRDKLLGMLNKEKEKVQEQVVETNEQVETTPNESDKIRELLEQ